MLGSIQTLLSGRNWLCLILKQHNKGYISFVLVLIVFMDFLYSALPLSLPSVCTCLTPSSLDPSLPPSLASSPHPLCLLSLPASHSFLHCLPSLTLCSPHSLLLSLAPSLLPELCPISTFLTFDLPPSLAPPFLPRPNKNLQSHMWVVSW